LKLVVLAGGGGTRLFPISRNNCPKQFSNLATEKSLLIDTLMRFDRAVSPEDIIIVTNKQYEQHVLCELKSWGLEAVHVILEPAARNTAPAIALAVQYCEDVLKADKSQCVLVAPSDHMIKPKETLISAVNKAEIVSSEGNLITFGIVPDKPETGYGYIKAHKNNTDKDYGYYDKTGALLAYKVDKFIEKPCKAKAEEYFSSGEYYWNSGMFAFTVEAFKEELHKYCPEISHLIEKGYNHALSHFEQMPKISIDYALAERSQRIAVVPLHLNWSDIGSWDALYDVLAKDTDGNALKGDCVVIDSNNSLLISSDRLVAAVGMEDVIIVETNDVIVVAKRGESQKIKDLVDLLKKNKRKEADEYTKKNY